MTRQVDLDMVQLIDNKLTVDEYLKLRALVGWKKLSREQAQKALDLGLSALTKVQEISDSAKAGIARKMGLATQKEVDALREELEAKLAASEKAE